MNNPHNLPSEMTDPRLRNATREAASWDVVLIPTTPSKFFERVRNASKELKQIERELVRLPSSSADLSEARHEAFVQLRANYRLMRSVIATMSEKRKQMDRLPRVISGTRADSPRIALVAENYLLAVDGSFAEKSFSGFLHVLQTNEPLTLEELWNIADFLHFSLLESLLSDAKALLLSLSTVSVPMLIARIKSLRSIANADWKILVEPLIPFDSFLQQDPAHAYSAMNFASREYYRTRIARVARYSDCPEMQVARAVLHLAQKAVQEPVNDARLQLKRSHVGYYIFDKGFSLLADQVGFHPSLLDRTRALVRRHASEFFIESILLLSVFGIAIGFFPVLDHFSGILPIAIAIALLVFPVMQCAVDFVNNSISALFEPAQMPRLDFSESVPAEYATLVAVPSLLLNEKQVHKLISDLEVRFLANRDQNLHFALLTDLPDSISQPRDKDSHPLVDLAVRLIDGLNTKYAAAKGGNFILLHRHRTFNVRQGVWMGWERKRGKLIDLNKLLTNESDPFPIKSGKLDALKQIRYVLTLDSDTQLPPGSAAQLTGTIAHPLNQAVIDPKRRIVTEGYGILQPRTSVTVQSVSRSRLASIFSGQTGFDIYTRAVSNAYQDLFGEGIFTGKGIYEVEPLHEVLNSRFPRNAILSHDLIEGAYARAGLVTDVELVEDYPTHYSAYSRRQHRWVRGDWQIVRWLLSRVRDESGRLVPNPISDISRWKIFDNLRRSLVDPALFFLFVSGWIGLPGGPLYWTIVSLLLLILPTLTQLAFAMSHTIANGQKGRIAIVLSGFMRQGLIDVLHLALLPHQLLLALDAIVRSLIRSLITGKRLLEWETAAQAELHSSRRSPTDLYLVVTPLLTIGIAVLIWTLAPSSDAILIATPVLTLWLLGSLITSWLNQSPNKRKQLSQADSDLLLNQALPIWRYFHQFSTERHHYLIPDNVTEEGTVEAARVSPTNVGLLLNARQAAHELGFITMPEFADLSKKTLATITSMEKFRGHLYNWYDTTTLQPMASATTQFISSVDSGNFVASLYTLHAGALDLLRKPLLSSKLISGLRAHWMLLRASKDVPSCITKLSVPQLSAAFADWLAWTASAETALDEAIASPSVPDETQWWLTEAKHRITAIQTLLHDYMPWVQAEFAPLRALPQLGLQDETPSLSVEDAPVFAMALKIRLEHARDKLAMDPKLRSLNERLQTLLPPAIEQTRALANVLRNAAQDSERLAEETEFGFLVQPYRQILSIGYDAKTEKLNMEACYDMLASEARIGTFLAIARGDLPHQSWFKLSRDQAYASKHFALLSWTGTMFEYLMPSLWMRGYENTLISQTQSSAVYIQRAFARGLGLPWGISESGAAKRNSSGDYHYQAYGVPTIALSHEASAGPVISPYSTFLALGVDAPSSLKNLRRMIASGWNGAYGLYEAADYTESRRTPELVREWMAHHQGMSLLSITNVLHENVVQQWFHSNALVQATELLLHEVPPQRSILKSRMKALSALPATT